MTAADAMRAAGLAVATRDDGWLEVETPAGCARVLDGSAAVAIRRELAGGDPIALARLSTHFAMARVVLIGGRPFTQQSCAVEALAAMLEHPARPDPKPPPVIEILVGEFAAVLPPLAGRTFLRLFPPATDVVDRARAAHLLAVSARLRLAGGWVDGPGVVVDPPTALAAEVYEVAHALRVLGDESVARDYLELTQPRVPAAGGDAPTSMEEDCHE